MCTTAGTLCLPPGMLLVHNSVEDTRYTPAHAQASNSIEACSKHCTWLPIRSWLRPVFFAPVTVSEDQLLHCCLQWYVLMERQGLTHLFTDKPGTSTTEVDAPCSNSNNALRSASVPRSPPPEPPARAHLDTPCHSKEQVQLDSSCVGQATASTRVSSLGPGSSIHDVDPACRGQASDSRPVADQSHATVSLRPAR
jgi:hypothetical protein